MHILLYFLSNNNYIIDIHVTVTQGFRCNLGLCSPVSSVLTLCVRKNWLFYKEVAPTQCSEDRKHGQKSLYIFLLESNVQLKGATDVLSFEVLDSLAFFVNHHFACFNIFNISIYSTSQTIWCIVWRSLKNYIILFDFQWVLQNLQKGWEPLIVLRSINRFDIQVSCFTDIQNNNSDTNSLGLSPIKFMSFFSKIWPRVKVY